MDRTEQTVGHVQTFGDGHVLVGIADLEHLLLVMLTLSGLLWMCAHIIAAVDKTGLAADLRQKVERLHALREAWAADLERAKRAQAAPIAHTRTN